MHLGVEAMICAYHAVFRLFSGLGNGPPLPRAEKGPFGGVLEVPVRRWPKSCPVVHKNYFQKLQNAICDVDSSPVAPFLDLLLGHNCTSGFGFWHVGVPLDSEILENFWDPLSHFSTGLPKNIIKINVGSNLFGPEIPKNGLKAS